MITKESYESPDLVEHVAQAIEAEELDDLWARSTKHELRRAQARAAMDAALAGRKRPHGAQEYKGFAAEQWQYSDASTTYRLRVPGGWLYRCEDSTTFVPVPAAVGYAV